MFKNIIKYTIGLPILTLLTIGLIIGGVAVLTMEVIG